MCVYRVCIHWRTSAHKPNECFIKMDVCHWNEYTHEQKIRACVCSQQTRTHTYAHIQVEREANNDIHSHLYKHTPVHNRRRITFECIQYYYFFILLLFFFLLFVRALFWWPLSFSFACLLTHSHAPFICGVCCLTKF